MRKHLQRKKMNQKSLKNQINLIFFTFSFWIKSIKKSVQIIKGTFVGRPEPSIDHQGRWNFSAPKSLKSWVSFNVNGRTEFAMLSYTKSWSQAVKSLDKRWGKGLEDRFLLFDKSKVFFFHIENWDIFGPQHMAQILFELWVQKCKKSIVVLFLSGVFRIQRQAVLILFCQILVIHAFFKRFYDFIALRI